jgi:hypothetical protein
MNEHDATLGVTEDERATIEALIDKALNGTDAEHMEAMKALGLAPYCAPIHDPYGTCGAHCVAEPPLLDTADGREHENCLDPQA